jgi:hypothetical protein
MNSCKDSDLFPTILKLLSLSMRPPQVVELQEKDSGNLMSQLTILLLEREPKPQDITQEVKELPQLEVRTTLNCLKSSIKVFKRNNY